MAELARNSVRCSSFESIIKEYYLGTEYEKMYKTISILFIINIIR